MDYKVGYILKSMRRGWTVIINGKERKGVSKIEIKSNFGTLTYGLQPEGFDGWCFQEQGGGGAVTIPYTTTPDGELLVGLLLERRVKMGDRPVWCVIGGFIDPGETYKQAQRREAAEESGLDTAEAKEFAGPPSNSNRGFFVADADAGEGVHAYGSLISFNDLEADGPNWKIKDTALLKGFKKAEEVRFFRWREAVRISPDALARAAIAQLLATVL